MSNDRCPKCDSRLTTEGNHDRLFSQAIEVRCPHCKVSGFGFTAVLAREDFNNNIKHKRDKK
jgi:phage FluMu protein Com